MFSSLPLIETEILLTGGCHGGAVADMASSNVGQKKSKFPHACLKIFRASRNSNPEWLALCISHEKAIWKGNNPT